MNADGIARWYRLFEYAAFGRSLERRRFQFLTQAGQNKTALILGDGDGRFLRGLLRLNPDIQVDSIDSSREMLRLARRRTGAPDNVHWHHADARNFRPAAAKYDLVVTHFFLDCFNQADCDQLIQRMTAATVPGTVWILSEFERPPRGIAKLWGRIWIALCYAFFRLTTKLETRRLPNYKQPLTNAGFVLEQRRVSGTGLLVSELWRRPQ